jgi:hypothetical protein
MKTIPEKIGATLTCSLLPHTNLLNKTGEHTKRLTENFDMCSIDDNEIQYQKIQ